MKKLNLRSFSAFHKGNLLSRNQLKNVLGGETYGYSGSGKVTCTITIAQGCFGYGGASPTITTETKALAEAECERNKPCCASLSC